jgi:proteasome lid subunit RPN8/RPN11
MTDEANPMTIYLSRSGLAAIHNAALAAYPRECCGLLIGQRTCDEAGQEVNRQVMEIHPLANSWTDSVLAMTDPDSAVDMPLDQHRRYWADPQTLLQVQRDCRDRHLDIIGVYHSHPDHPAIPSECDLRLAWPVYSYVIVSVTQVAANQRQIVDLRSWQLDDAEQFQSEAVKILEEFTNKDSIMA